MGDIIISENNLFEWDSRKNSDNIKKHGFGFDEIIDVFLDPYLITLYDEKHSSEEDRFYSVGSLHGLLIIVVYHTERDGRTRIISARQAEKKLQEVYYGFIRKING